MAITLNGTTGITAPAFDGPLDAADIPDASIAAAKLASGAAAANLGSYVSSVNGQTGAVTVSSTPTTSEVLSATAGASVGAVGTYAMFKSISAGAFFAGLTTAGSNLRYSNAFGVNNVSGTPAGTWRCMGTTAGVGNPDQVSVFLRIS